MEAVEQAGHRKHCTRKIDQIGQTKRLKKLLCGKKKKVPFNIVVTEICQDECLDDF